MYSSNISIKSSKSHCSSNHSYWNSYGNNEQNYNKQLNNKLEVNNSRNLKQSLPSEKTNTLNLKSRTRTLFNRKSFISTIDNPQNYNDKTLKINSSNNKNEYESLNIKQIKIKQSNFEQFDNSKYRKPIEDFPLCHPLKRQRLNETSNQIIDNLKNYIYKSLINYDNSNKSIINIENINLQSNRFPENLKKAAILQNILKKYDNGQNISIDLNNSIQLIKLSINNSIRDNKIKSKKFKIMKPTFHPNSRLSKLNQYYSNTEDQSINSFQGIERKIQSKPKFYITKNNINNYNPIINHKISLYQPNFISTGEIDSVPRQLYSNKYESALKTGLFISNSKKRKKLRSISMV
ncbi:hypothetical protein WICMUC_001659 [Wickerhamomyces mucosus]|uniref:Uncharacterized protein n=1 Tax=Wickerhamomyces mucosus TaxID=1378264 RepID=A0A9P8PTN4_9ASCO|nr:hypothetical protein WICMUC_001659 [Wickerhamomyces mucosus]